MIEKTNAKRDADDTDANPTTAPANEHAAAPPPDPFDPAALRLDQTFLEGGGAKKLLLTVPVRKPGRHDFVRVRAEPNFRENLAVIELKEERETYLIHPAVAANLPGEFSMSTVHTAISRQGVVFLWPVKLPAPDGRIMEWHRSAAAAAELAMHRWVRVTADMSLGAYQIFEASAVIPEPVWPELSYRELLRIGFRDRLVDTLDHPLVARLRGLS